MQHPDLIKIGSIANREKEGSLPRLCRTCSRELNCFAVYIRKLRKGWNKKKCNELIISQ